MRGYRRKRALLCLFALLLAPLAACDGGGDASLVPAPSALTHPDGGFQAEDCPLLLVNPWNPLPPEYRVSLAQLPNGQFVDRRMEPSLRAMLEDMAAQGLSPVVCSAYRTWEKQTSLYSAQVDRYLARGYSPAAAETEAARWVAPPGTSEHQTGLAVDIVSADDQLLDEHQAETPEQQWLLANAHRYGFILRYPEGKEPITGIGYEPWHYRWVGEDYAREILEKGCCLEEIFGESCREK